MKTLRDVPNCPQRFWALYATEVSSFGNFLKNQILGRIFMWKRWGMCRNVRKYFGRILCDRSDFTERFYNENFSNLPWLRMIYDFFLKKPKIVIKVASPRDLFRSFFFWRFWIFFYTLEKIRRECSWSPLTTLSTFSISKKLRFSEKNVEMNFQPKN